LKRPNEREKVGVNYFAKISEFLCKKKLQQKFENGTAHFISFFGG
jgi:hypothetical protein